MTTPTPAPTGAAARRLRTRATAAVALAAAALLVASGCAATANAESGTPDAAATHAGAELTFGTPFEYADGLFVQVKQPARFTPTAQAEWDRSVEGVPVRIRLTITNGTREEYIAHTLSATVESGGQAAAQIVDPGTQIDLTGPSLTLTTAGVVNFDLAFVVQDPSDVTLTVVPALGGYEPLVLTTG
ncbi:hypothetical protein [Cellulomonas sp. S1-8]|uniref:hypothetical protein n=1 Tax=Cellulomonas sp. S1-8 TaxID=2904790 RepID=UPI002244CE7E|nr:hypothetical protein [Cellulomonas sp. S1-8]UZN03547.1 hypothetical protein OKX07_00960 [Cellulomonas sp. S1-8]